MDLARLPSESYSGLGQGHSRPVTALDLTQVPVGPGFFPPNTDRLSLSYTCSLSFMSVSFPIINICAHVET